MSRILITGSSDGLGFLTAQKLISQGHDVVLHARNKQRAADVKGRLQGVHNIFIGDLANIEETRGLAEQANQLGRFDTVIHNAGIYGNKQRRLTSDGLCETFAVNVLAPYVLSALMERPERMLFLSSSMHRQGCHDGSDINWEKRTWNNTQAYAESKFYDTVLACALSRLWPAGMVNSVDPGWVPTRMGGPSASDDLQKGYETQAWLAVSDDSQAQVTGQLFYHMNVQEPAESVKDPLLQQRLLDYCRKISGADLR